MSLYAESYPLCLGVETVRNESCLGSSWVPVLKSTLAQCHLGSLFYWLVDFDADELI